MVILWLTLYKRWIQAVHKSKAYKQSSEHAVERLASRYYNRSNSLIERKICRRWSREGEAVHGVLQVKVKEKSISNLAQCLPQRQRELQIKQQTYTSELSCSQQSNSGGRQRRQQNKEQWAPDRLERKTAGSIRDKVISLRAATRWDRIDLKLI